MNADLTIIKKKYGEEMSHLCRELFPTILEQEGLLSKLLLDNFESSHFLYEDIVKHDLVNDFKNVIYNQINVEEEKSKEELTKTPQELLNKAGYDLYECHSESDIQKFKEYYASGEALCTFRGGRLKNCYVFFAVKKNVDQIRRSDFKYPKRQDEYGTSVISIQFTRGDAHTLSIKNRYNHTVDNPDATFSNNLDNIIPGLTDSFSEYYGLEQKNKNGSFEIPGYVRANDGKYYPYNMEINNVYYCPNNIVIKNFEVYRYNKDDVLLFDYFLMNFKTKEIIGLDDSKDGFLELCSNIEKIEVLKKEKNKIIRIYDQKAGLTEIEINKKNTIIKLKNETVPTIGYDFLCCSCNIKSVCLTKAEHIGDYFLCSATKTEEVILPQAQYIGKSFLKENKGIKIISLPKAKIIDSWFLRFNRALSYINLPEVEKIKDCFLEYNNTIQTISLPKVKEIGNDFMSNSQKLRKINLSNVEYIGENFLFNNTVLNEIQLLNAKYINSGFLMRNNTITTLYLPNAKTIGTDFMCGNRILEMISLPNIENIGDNFLFHNKEIKRLELPKVEYIGKNFLFNNTSLNEIQLLNVRHINSGFLEQNNTVTTLYLPNVKTIGAEFMCKNRILETLTLTRVEKIGAYFLRNNLILKTLDLPSVKYIDHHFMQKIKILKS